MAKIAGVSVLLSVKDGGTDRVLGGQSGATISMETNIIEVTSKDGNGWTENVAGVKSWSMECEGFMVKDDTSWEFIETSWQNGTEVDVTIAFADGKKYSGKALIESCGAEFPQDDAASYSLSLTGTGALTFTAAGGA